MPIRTEEETVEEGVTGVVGVMGVMADSRV